MWGKGLRMWFELFAGIAVFQMTDKGADNKDGWINIKEYEDRFKREELNFGGKQYNPSDKKQRNDLLNAIINNASLLCTVKLLERRRNIIPPSLDYRVTKLGRRVDTWGYGDRPKIRKKLLFFFIEVVFRLKRYRKWITIAASCWTILNALKFFGAMFEGLRNDVFAVVSAIAIGVAFWWGQFFSSGGSE